MKTYKKTILLALPLGMGLGFLACGNEGTSVDEGKDTFEDEADSKDSDTDESPAGDGDLDIDRERQPHEPILIDGNDDFAARAADEGWPGSGTEDDPYIIEGLEIDLEKKGIGAIDIRNTDVHFVIRDCYLHNGGQAWINSSAQGYGVIARNVRNMRVERTIAVECFEGIWLKNTEDSVLHYNDFSRNSGHGISLESSHRNVMEYNKCNKEHDDGILVGRSFAASNENIFRYNTFAGNGTSGLNLSAGTGNVIYGNVFDAGNGMHVMAIVKNNTLYDEESKRGNWWKNHTEPDADGDGIVDEPKKTTAGPDNYPLVEKPSTRP